jgi:2-polyprenyl-6-hydroxyphenyl methylase/3-demethylubiquinone-9 3-methyltransferase
VVLRKLIDGQVRIARRIDRMLPAIYHRDGHLHFKETTVPRFLAPDLCIYDVGGGKRPYLSPEAKRELNARVVGIDIDAAEVARAPEGAYDRIIATDIAAFTGEGDADLIVCQAVFEHVSDVPGAVRALSTILAPGGTALLFVPCRNALFARLNLLLPESLKRRLLFSIYPEVREHQGFPTHYRDCTPSALSRHARAHGLEVVEVETHWASSYFQALLPVYVVWRAWTVIARSLGLRDCCETFTLVLRRPLSS